MTEEQTTKMQIEMTIVEPSEQIQTLFLGIDPAILILPEYRGESLEDPNLTLVLRTAMVGLSPEFAADALSFLSSYFTDPEVLKKWEEYQAELAKEREINAIGAEMDSEANEALRAAHDDFEAGASKSD